MKKSIICLALVSMASFQVIANPVVLSNPVETHLKNAGIEPGRFDVNFEDGFMLSGEIERLGENSYMYNAELIATDGESVGAFVLYFQTENWGSEEVVNYDSMFEEYGNDWVNTIMNKGGNVTKSHKQTLKGSIGNLR